MHVVALEAVATVQERQLEHECDADHAPAETLDELDLGPRGPAGCEHVVEHDDPGAGRYGVAVNVETVGPVLERVGRLEGLARQLSGLAGGDETRAELVGERGSEDESASFCAEDEIRLSRARPVGELPDRLGEVLARRRSEA